eukprot:365838-Chlamydomonas_euryale.AAC.4
MSFVCLKAGVRRGGCVPPPPMHAHPNPWLGVGMHGQTVGVGKQVWSAEWGGVRGRVVSVCKCVCGVWRWEDDPLFLQVHVWKCGIPPSLPSRPHHVGQHINLEPFPAPSPPSKPKQPSLMAAPQASI